VESVQLLMRGLGARRQVQLGVARVAQQQLWLVVVHHPEQQMRKKQWSNLCFFYNIELDILLRGVEELQILFVVLVFCATFGNI